MDLKKGSPMPMSKDVLIELMALAKSWKQKGHWLAEVVFERLKSGVETAVTRLCQGRIKDIK